MATPPFAQQLRAIFRDEAREHLAQIAAGLVALEQAGEAGRGLQLERLARILHTLKGAARSVDEGELESLCHALESVLAAEQARPDPASAERFDQLHAAAAAARQVVDAPGPRGRKQAAAMAAQLNASAAQLAQWPDKAPGHADFTEAAVPETKPVPEVQAEAGMRIHVEGRSIDAIRVQAEALLPVELNLGYHAEQLATLAIAIGAGRRAASDGTDGTVFEMACTRLATQLDHTRKELHAVRTRLLDAVLETALVPCSAAFDELPVLVRNLARGHDKQVILDTRGADIEIDRRVLGMLREALLHLVTNAVDHGIEPPAQRRAAGKPTAGRITVAVAQRDARTVAVSVSDDGAGIDPGSMAHAAARCLGMDAAALAEMGEQQRLQLALRAGVSTRTEVSLVSGRGMGLAIVADKVACADGKLTVTAAPGAGATFELLLPVGVAAMRTLVIRAGEARYALPLEGLASVCAAAQAAIRTVEGRETVLAGGRVLPLVRLAPLFGAAGAPPGAGAGVVLVAHAAGQDFAMLADAVLGEQELLPKRLGPMLRRVRYVSGAAQLGDGSLAPVIALEDVAIHGLASFPGTRATQARQDEGRRILVVEDSVTSRLLLRHILESAGFGVETAADGLEALSRLRGARFDAVVSDIEMPNMDGLALTASIRANQATAELPVILVTSLQTPAQQAAGLHAGADAYFTKGSFDQDRLLAAVRRVTGMETP